jgi:hypothetical protein
MIFLVGSLLLVVAALVFSFYRKAMGSRVPAVIGVLGIVGCTLCALHWEDDALPPQVDVPPSDDNASARTNPSQACFSCHQSQFNSWHATYHRTMTQEATPENVKANFNNAEFTYLGVTSRMTREGDRFYVETIDPEAEIDFAHTDLGTRTLRGGTVSRSARTAITIWARSRRLQLPRFPSGTRGSAPRAAPETGGLGSTRS